MQFSINEKVRMIGEPDKEGTISKRFMAENTCEAVYIVTDGIT